MNHPLNDFGIYSGEELLNLQLPPRQPLMGNWLVESSITLLYAPRGVGKSNFALGLAVALAKGEPFVGFSNTCYSPVMVLDGEMPAYELQRRVKALSGGAVPEGLHFYSAGLVDEPMESLSTEDGQNMVCNFLEELGSRVLIIDNKSTMMTSFKENEANSWEEAQRWLIRMRNLGYAIILVHHAGKSGQQRGSSMVEVTPDIIIKLDKPKDDTGGEDESRFVLTFEKNRHLVGEELKPKLITLRMEENSAIWQVAPYTANPKAQEAIKLAQKGMNQRAIAQELSVSLGTVNNYLKEAS